MNEVLTPTKSLLIEKFKYSEFKRKNLDVNDFRKESGGAYSPFENSSHVDYHQAIRNFK